MTQPTWTEKLEYPASEARTLIRFFLKKQIFSEDSAWTDEGGGLWSAAFDYGYVSTLICSAWQGNPADPMISIFAVDLQDDAEQLNNCDTVADISNPGDWSFDQDAKRVYLMPYAHALGSDPNDADYTFEFLVFASTHGGYYPITPGTTQPDVEWPALISKCPLFKQSFADQLFGFLPVESSTITLLNNDGSFDKYLYDVIWRSAKFETYNDFLYKPGQIENYRKTMLGRCQYFSQDENELSVNVKSFIDILDRDYDLSQVQEYSFTSVRFQDKSKLVRKIFGRVSGFIPISVNYDPSASTSTNRDWVFSRDAMASHPNLTFTVDDTYTNDDTHTKLTATPTGLNINDKVKIVCAGTPKYADITDIDYATKIITHTTISGRSDAPGDTLYRPFVGCLFLLDDVTRYSLYPGRDFTVMDFAGCAGIRLTNNFESSINLIDTGNGTIFDPSKMELQAYVYGDTTLARLPDSTNLGATSKRGGAYSNPIGVLLSIINSAGRTDGSASLVDQDSFVSEFAAEDDYVGFAVPELSTDGNPKYRDVVVKLLNSFLGRLYLRETSSGPALSVNRIGPTGAADFTITAEDILTYSQDTNYEDAPSAMNFKYSFQEKAIFPQAVNFGAFPPNTQFPSFGDQDFFYNFKNGRQARWGYFTKKVLDFETYLDADYSQEAADQINLLANRASWLISERRNTLTLLLKNRFFEANIGDTIELQRDSIPGFEYTFGTLQTRKFILVEKQQSVYGVTLVLDDQKGVEDHSGDWS